MLNRKAFYDALRGGTMFPRGFTPEQVAGFERLLDVWEKYFPNDSDFLLAYNLGTSFHETAATMQPITERGARSYFDKYEPGTELGKMLGNTVKGDGFKFRGEGDVQNTGRANAAKATKRINELFGLGIDLVANPEKRGDPFISAISLFLGNKEGWWTGKDLLDYIDGIPESEAEDLREFTESRRVVNGTDKAAKIAGYGMAFYKALQAARRPAPALITGTAGAVPGDSLGAPGSDISKQNQRVEVIPGSDPGLATRSKMEPVQPPDPPPAVIASDEPIAKASLWSAFAEALALIWKGRSNA